MHLLFAASEVAGFAKTGRTGRRRRRAAEGTRPRGHRCAIITPLYHSARAGKAPLRSTEHVFTVPIGDRQVSGRLWAGDAADSDVPVYWSNSPTTTSGTMPARAAASITTRCPTVRKRDYPDNCALCLFLPGRSRSNAAARRLAGRASPPRLADRLVPVYLKELYAAPPHRVAGALSARPHFSLRFNNIAYQGLFWHWDMALLGLDWRLFNYKQLEFYGHLNFLKAGIVFADLITTVSQRYAAEILTPYFGCGLEGVLAERRDRLFGIVNGADYLDWNPATDRNLAANYDANTVQRGKPVCKAALQRRLGLPAEPRTVRVSEWVSRLVEHKGLDLVGRAAEALLQAGTQLVILGLRHASAALPTRSSPLCSTSRETIPNTTVRGSAAGRVGAGGRFAHRLAALHPYWRRSSLPGFGRSPGFQPR